MQFKKDERSEIKSTSHSRYRCQYHIVFAPKYHRKEIYGKLKKDIGKTLRTLCKQKNVEILEAEACIDHIHMLVSIPPYLNVVQFMGYLKGKSSLMIFDRHANLGSVKIIAQNYLQAPAKRSQPAMKASSRAVSRCFIFMYFLLPHWVPATWRSRAQTSIRAELPSGNAPTTRVRRRISRFSRSITLLVRMRVQCSLGKSQ